MASEWTEEQRRKQSEKMKKRWADPELMRGKNHPHYGKKHTEETKIKCGLANKGRVLSDDHKKKMVDGGKKWWDEEGREKVIKSWTDKRREQRSKDLSKIWEDQELRQKQSEIMKKRWADPEFRKRRLIAYENAKKTGEDHPFYGKTHTPEARKKMSDALKGRTLPEEQKKKMSEGRAQHGGVQKNQLSLFDTYAHRLEGFEEVRRDPQKEYLLQVRCVYCDQWFSPNRSTTQLRVAIFEGKSDRDLRFYCSEECKANCPIYHVQKFPRGYKRASSREVDPELRKEVFHRDNHTCQKCGAISNLHCHHILSAVLNPMLQNDPDNCITLCKPCHKEVHKTEDCRYIDLRCKNGETHGNP